MPNDAHPIERSTPSMSIAAELARSSERESRKVLEGSDAELVQRNIHLNDEPRLRLFIAAVLAGATVLTPLIYPQDAAIDWTLYGAAAASILLYGMLSLPAYLALQRRGVQFAPELLLTADLIATAALFTLLEVESTWIPVLLLLRVADHTVWGFSRTVVATHLCVVAVLGHIGAATALGRAVPLNHLLSLTIVVWAVGIYLSLRARTLQRLRAEPARLARASQRLVNALETQNAQLEQQADELERSRQKAVDASRAKSEFLANISHEIRTPMNGVLGMTELLASSRLDTEQRGHLDLVNSSANSLLHILNDLLDFSKIEAGRMSIERLPFSLRGLLKDILEVVRPNIEAKGVQLEAVIAPQVPDRIIGDPVRLRQVLINLLSNSEKFTTVGSIALLVDLESASLGEATLHFRVQDTGVGIPPDKLESIFDAFTQADASTTRRFGGTGLGLAICRQIADLLDGRIWVESSEQEGSTFHLTLPFGIEEVKPEATASIPLQRRRVVALERVTAASSSDASQPADSTLSLDNRLRRWGVAVTAHDDGDDVVLAHQQAAQRGRPFELLIVGPLGGRADAELRWAQQLIKATELPAVAICSSVDESSTEAAAAIGVTAILPNAAQDYELAHALQVILRGVEDGVRLPLLTQERLASIRPKIRVLLAEDNRVNQRVAVAMLEKGGYSVDVCSSGVEALELYQASDYDVVLLDVQMPEMDGLRTVEELRKLEDGHRTPVIAVTAHALKGDRENMLTAGFDDYLAKPLRAEHLYATLERVAPAASVIKPLLRIGQS